MKTEFKCTSIVRISFCERRITLEGAPGKIELVITDNEVLNKFEVGEMYLFDVQHQKTKKKV